MLPIWPTAANVAGSMPVMCPKLPDSDPVSGRPEKPDPSSPAIMPITRIPNAVTNEFSGRCCWPCRTRS
jgi:hypothetical protein